MRVFALHTRTPAFLFLSGAIVQNLYSSEKVPVQSGKRNGNSRAQGIDYYCFRPSRANLYFFCNFVS